MSLIQVTSGQGINADALAIVAKTELQVLEIIKNGSPEPIK